LERLNAILRAIRNVNQLIVRERDPRALIQETCRLLVERRGYNSAWIALLDEDGGVRATAQTGLGQAFDPILERLSRRELPPCARETLDFPGVHVFHEPATECSGCPLISGYRGRSAMSVRLSYGTRTYGMMGLSMSPASSDDEEEPELVREVAGDIGFALHAVEHDALDHLAAEELRHERDMTATLLDTSPVAITVVDAGGAIVQANAEAERVLGLQKNAITHRTYNDPAWHIVDYDGNPFPVEQLPVSRVLSEKRAVHGVEHAIQWPGGERVLLSINAVPVWSERGDIARIVCTMQDVTAERQMDAALRESEERFRSLFEQSMDAIWILRPDGTGNVVNRAWLDMFGYEAEDIPSLRAVDLYADPAEREGFLRRIAESGFVRDEVRFKRKDGTVFHCERAVVALRDAAGRVVRFQGVIRDITERKRTEAALRESEDKYRSLFEQSLDAIWIGRPDGSGNDVNPAWLKMFGYAAEDMPSLNAADVYADPRDRTEFLHRMAEAGTFTDEVRFKRKDGTEFLCERRVVGLRDATGKAVSFQGIIRDITARKRAEEVLRESEQKYRALFEQSGDAVSVVALDGRLLDANPAWLALFGCAREELPNLNMRDFYAEPGGREDFLKRIAGVGWLKDEVRFRRRDGSVFLCDRSVVVLKDASGADIGFQATVRDITEIRAAERALRESEERFRGVFEHGPMGIAILDAATYRFVRANRAYQQIVGYSEDELKQMTVADVTVAEDWERQQRLVRARLDAGYGGYAVEKRYVRKDGGIRDVIVVGETMRLAPDSAPQFIASVLDITDRKRVESELAESRENLRLLAQRVEQAREDERTTIARELHDRVGQTLTALKLDIDRLKRTMAGGDARTNTVLSGMEAMVNDGADDVRRISSELRPGALDDLGLEGAIEWQIDQLRPRTDVGFTFTRSEESCLTDAARTTALFRVFQELVTNVVRHAGAKRVDVSLRTSDGTCELLVADDGRGIDAAQVNDRHSLGIVGMRERLLPYGGELHLEGAPGKGTTARVVMPLQ
jgi:PAS domain S-box-containing protein